MKRNVRNTKFQTQNTTKGITLVALVITIIVLLILAGVAINMAINSDGLFGKANEATEKWNESVEKEGTAISDLLTELDKVSPMKVEISTDIPEDWDDAKVSAVATAGSRKAPIPKGFTVSSIEGENTIGGGLVIYQGDDPVTGTAGSDAHTTAMTTRNQFVWIPVDDINYMVMCKSNAEGSVCDLELVNGILKCTNTEHTSTATDLCGRVYETTKSNTTVDSKKIYTYSQTFTESQWASQIWSTSSYREPDIVNKYDADDTDTTTYMATAGIASGKVADFQNQLTSDFTAMATSVAKYGGFYVSRYETGENGASLKNQKVLVDGATTYTGYDADTFANGNMWYGMYNALRTSSAVNKTAVNSHMIWGSQSDMIIKFLGENSTNESQVGHTARQLATQELTGETTTDIMSNIYDLEGNNREWTAQAYSTSSRTYRGGFFSLVATDSKFIPASYRYRNYPNDEYCGYGSRSALYVQ